MNDQIYPNMPDQPQSVTPAGPSRHFPVKVAAIIVLTLASIGLLIFGLWAYSQYTSVKGPVEEQRAAAAEAARADERAKLEQEFKQKEKEPFVSYMAPGVFGAFTFKYPKTWSLYAFEDESGKLQLDVYGNPETIRTFKSKTNSYAFRLKLERELYSEAVEDYQDLVEDKLLSVQTVKVSGITGTRYSGQLDKEHSGDLILLPVRDKTLYVWTEGKDYLEDFDRLVKTLAITP